MTTRSRFFFASTGTFTLGAVIACALSTASAAPISTGAPATRALGPAAPRPGAIATQPPSVLHADLVVDGNGVQIGSRFAQFGTTAPINSTSMTPLAPQQQARERGAQPCHFTGSFAVKNAGAVQSEAVDVYSWAEQPQGPQVGKIGDMGYGNPALAPGARQTWTFALDLAPGSYVFHVVIDPKRLNRQYTTNLIASCGLGTIPQMRAPNALAPAGTGIGSGPQQTQSAGSAGASTFHAPSGGIKIAPAAASQAGIGIQSSSSHQLAGPVLTCSYDSTPRVNTVNGRPSGNQFKPGGKLDISGCGFGTSGRAWLVDGASQVPLVVESWGENTILAHIDSRITGVLDLANAGVAIQPNGAPYIHSTVSFGKFSATRQVYNVTSNVNRYVTLHIIYGESTTFGGWGQPWAGRPVAVEPDGTVRRVSNEYQPTANAEDALVFLDPGKGFKVVKPHVTWLTVAVNNGKTDRTQGGVIQFFGSNKLHYNQYDGWIVDAGDQFFQETDDPRFPLACQTDTTPLRGCHYSIYRISLDVSGPVGVSPP